MKVSSKLTQASSQDGLGARVQSHIRGVESRSPTCGQQGGRQHPHSAPHSVVTWDPSPEAVMQSVIAGPGALVFYVQPAWNWLIWSLRTQPQMKSGRPGMSCWKGETTSSGNHWKSLRAGRNTIWLLLWDLALVSRIDGRIKKQENTAKALTAQVRTGVMGASSRAKAQNKRVSWDESQSSVEKTLMLGKTEGRRSGWQDDMVGWHHRLNGHEFEQARGDSEGQEAWHPAVMRLQSWTRQWLDNNKAQWLTILREGQGGSIRGNSEVPTRGAAMQWMKAESTWAGAHLRQNRWWDTAMSPAWVCEEWGISPEMSSNGRTKGREAARKDSGWR